MVISLIRLLLISMNLVTVTLWPAHAADLDLPEGWRVLELSELKDTTDYPFRSSGEGFLNVVADFDGDDEKDVAQFLVRTDGSEYALFIITRKGNTPVYNKLQHAQTLTEISRLGIQRAPPGKYVTACGKGYWDCSAHEPPEIKLKHPGIELFVF